MRRNSMLARHQYRCLPGEDCLFFEWFWKISNIMILPKYYNNRLMQLPLRIHWLFIRIKQYLNFLFRFSIEGRMSPGFRLELSTSLLVFVDDIFRRIAASNSCSRPCGLSMVLGGGVNISSGIGVLCCSPWKKIWMKDWWFS